MKISIIGCGWLGIPLGKKLAAKHEVLGTTTQFSKFDTLAEAGIKPVLLRLPVPAEQQQQANDLLQCDLLFINIPPGRDGIKDEDYHERQIRSLFEASSHKPKHCIYISSTGVYPNLDREVVEQDVQNATEAEHIQIARAEDYLKNLIGENLCILRLGGLVGNDRTLIKYFAGKTDLPNGDYPVNLVHQQEVIKVVEFVLDKNLWGQTYNVCSPEHPIKRDFYPALCKKMGQPLPHFLPGPCPFKIINVAKLQKQGYQFIYTNPLDFDFTVQ